MVGAKEEGKSSSPRWVRAARAQWPRFHSRAGRDGINEWFNSRLGIILFVRLSNIPSVYSFVRHAIYMHPPSASKFTDPDTHRRIAYDAFANIRERDRTPSSVFHPRNDPVERDRDRSCHNIAGIDIIACARDLWVTFNRIGRGKKKKKTSDKSSAFIMQQLTITIVVRYAMDRWKIKETRLLLFLFALKTLRITIRLDEYKLYTYL